MTYKKLLIGLLVGLLLIGLGSGVAFWEFSSFEYMGDKQFVSKTQDIAKETIARTLEDFDETKSININVSSYYIDPENIQVVGDENLKQNQVCFDATYNRNLNQFVVYNSRRGYYPEQSESMERQYDTYFDVYVREKSKFLKNMEQVLNDLKERRLYSYQIEKMQQLVIRVSPQMVGRVIIEN